MHEIERKWLWVILAVAVLLRVGVALYLGDEIDAPPLLTDQRSYHALGQRLLAGHGFSFATNWYPFTLANTPTAHWSFLYSLFVAAVYAIFGPHPLAVRLVQAVLGGLLLPWMVYRLARQVFPGKAALHLVAAAIAAGYGYYMLYAATLMTETAYICLLLWSLEVGMRIGMRLRAGNKVCGRDVVWLGVSLGLAALSRQSILPWVPVLFLWLLWQARRGRVFAGAFRSLVLSGLILVALILPWTYRNYRAYGQFLLLNSNTGYAMYSAQHPMHGSRFSEFAAAPLPEDMARGNEAQMDRELLRRGLAFVLEDPWRYLLLCLSRVRAYLECWPTPDTTLLHNIGRVGSFGVFLPFMLYGLWRTLRDRDSLQRNALLLLFAVFYSVMHILTWAMVRYRLPVDAVCLPFAALGVRDLYVRGRTWLVPRRASVVARVTGGRQ
ncbi:MAG: hypothetical protein GX552_16405 [Chloroflexi bacterium]|nr:hypothetical protein [Chloroflexota bacterium]